jgi:peptidoglycan/xylan/chitin deacetylase (PgdA/CDA1 family)
MLLELLNGLQRHFASHVLLYHSTFSHVPADLHRHLHNVAPEELYRQLSWLKRHFDVVSVDQALLQPSTGQVAITFDDAYESVFVEAQPVLDALGVPYTVFINGYSFSGEPFWRDLVRLLINRGLVERFLAYARDVISGGAQITATGFYAQSKRADVNSARLHAVMRRFLTESAIGLESACYCLRDPVIIRPSAYLSLGNHSFHHYVLSSLSEAEQEQEIVRNHEVLRGLGHNISQVFAIPFGGEADFTDTTLSIIRRHGYRGVLYSRDRINLGQRRSVAMREGDRLVYAERYMAATTYPKFQKQIFRLAIASATTKAWS